MRGVEGRTSERGWVGGRRVTSGRSSDGVAAGPGDVRGALVDVLVMPDLSLQLHHLPLQLLVHAVDGVWKVERMHDYTTTTVLLVIWKIVIVCPGG